MRSTIFAAIVVAITASLGATSSSAGDDGCCQQTIHQCEGTSCPVSASGCFNTGGACDGTFVPGSTCNANTGQCEITEPGCCLCGQQPGIAPQGFGFCSADFGTCAFECNAPLFLLGGVCGDDSCSIPPPDDSRCEAPPTICPPADLSQAIFCQPGVPCAGTAAADVICGTDGDDLIMAKGQNDIICAGLGNDRVQAGAGDDVVDSHNGCGAIPAGGGATDDDRVYGSSGDDVIRTGSGNDTVLAGQGDDRVYGEAGNDNLRGNGGVDLLVGGADDDNVSGGGTGTDTCEAENESACERDCTIESSAQLRSY